MKPKVSILFPVYKTAAYLREAMDSMLTQTYTDFELICLDDCSPDNSAAIMDTYSDPRIVRYRGEKNVGLANVLNIGIDMARGEYIARMDSDDISLPNRLQFQVDYLDSHPDVDLLSVGMQQFGRINQVLRYDNSTERIKFNALFYSPIMHASSMWRKDKFKGLYFDQSKVPSEDYDMWTRALVKGIKMRNYPIVLYRYRMHDTQVNANPNQKGWYKVREEFLSVICPSLSSSQINDLSMTLLEGWGNDVCKLEEALHLVAKENEQSHFFDSPTLKRNIKRELQAVAYRQIVREGFSWSRLSYLGPSKLVRLVLVRLHII